MLSGVFGSFYCWMLLLLYFLNCTLYYSLVTKSGLNNYPDKSTAAARAVTQSYQNSLQCFSVSYWHSCDNGEYLSKVIQLWISNYIPEWNIALWNSRSKTGRGERQLCVAHSNSTELIFTHHVNLEDKKHQKARDGSAALEMVLLSLQLLQNCTNLDILE